MIVGWGKPQAHPNIEVSHQQRTPVEGILGSRCRTNKERLSKEFFARTEPAILAVVPCHFLRQPVFAPLMP